MSTIIVSDRPAVSGHLRKVLTAQGRDCPITHVLPLDQSARMLAGRGGVDLLFVVQSADLDRSAAVMRQLRAVSSARIVAVGAADDPRKILELLHAGADDYLDDAADIETQVVQVLQRLGASQRKGSPGRLIAVTGASGGVGATLVAVNLGVAFAQRQKGCGIVDLATAEGELADHLDLTPRHTLADVFRNIDSLDQEMLSQSLTPHASGASMLAGGASAEEFDALSPDDVERVVQLSRSQFPCNVVDLDRRNARRLRVLESADCILLLVRLEFASLCSARRILDEWKRREIEGSRILVVANRAGQPGEIPPSKTASILGRPLDCRLDDDPLTAGISINCGSPAVLEQPKSPLARGILTLADRIIPAEPQCAAPDSAAPAASLMRRAASILFC
ncbi:MAG: hypothetical protein KF774_21175 [Planctomyces sp.]|nr:hypothetical protein [Planctomyces sp.]